MKRIVIASHSRFAAGMKETLGFIMASDDGIYDISAYVDENVEPLEEIIAELFASFDTTDKVVVLTDLLSGSVNQKFFPYINENTFVVTGVNVPLALTIALASEENITAQFIKDSVEQARQMMIFVNEMKPAEEEEDE